MAKKKKIIDDANCFGFAACFEARLFCSITVLVLFSVIIVFVLLMATACQYFGSFICFFSSSGGSDFHSDDLFPSSKLQTKIISAASKTRVPAAISSTSTTPLLLLDSSFAINRSLPHQPILLEDQNSKQGLSRARAASRKASFLRRSISGGIYRKAAVFHRSYMEMEKRFKVYVYEEGELPMVHDGPCKNIYAIEGRFIQEIENGAHSFRTKDPSLAHVFFMPFSVTWMVKFLYKPNTYDVKPLQQFASDYVRVISTKYPFWNRTQGADHFMLSCHDWGPHASRGNEFLYNTSIRVLCNANSSEGFNPIKDVSLPEIHLFDGDVDPKLRSPPPENTSRPYLAFFAGGLHGPIRPILLQHWKKEEEDQVDTDFQVYEYLPKHLDYTTMMLQSKFCLCPSGHEVASPRIVEAIYAECVPVILSDHYVLPFSDVLRWEGFSIQVSISDIPRLKDVLMAVPNSKYMSLKKGLTSVRKHFVLNQPVQRFDMFHMILHSVWLRRINWSL